MIEIARDRGKLMIEILETEKVNDRDSQRQRKLMIEIARDRES